MTPSYWSHAMANRRLCISLMAIALAATAVDAQTVYKTTDKDGHTTYTERPPSTPAEKAHTEEMTVDPNQNVRPAPPQQSAPPTSSGTPPSAEDDMDEAPNRVAQAEADLQAAEQALADGQLARPGDFVGRKDGGVGPSPQRTSRISELQAAAERARAALESARSSGR